MDFHLCVGPTQLSWLEYPALYSSFPDETSSLGNWASFHSDGKLAGLIVGWTDQDLAQLWEALHEPGLERAKSLLAGADGTFAGVFQVEGSLYIMTDVSGSIPIFYGIGDGSVHVSTKAQTVAGTLRASLDPVSVADFIQNGAVCHPFTLFDSVSVAPPASISSFQEGQLESTLYWTPNEERCNASLADAAEQLRETVRSALHKGVNDARNTTVMFSGGEDARSLVKLLPEGKPYRLRLIADGKNREFALARRSAEKLGYQAELVVREPQHYRQQLDQKALWAGVGNDVRHYHVFGTTSEIMSHADAVVGGLGSDKLFKSDYLDNVVNKSKESFLPERLVEPKPERLVGAGSLAEMEWMRPEIADSVWRRRQSHHEMLLRYRPNTAGNWHTLWPLGGHSQAHSQFLNNIRYGPRVVEPFIAASTYRLAAVLPDKWKVDRKAFSAAFIPVMGGSAWVPTTAGRIPALNGLSGRLIQFAIKSWRVVYDELQKKWHPESYGNQGPWGSDHKGFEIDPGCYLTATLREQLDRYVEMIANPESGVDGFWGQTGPYARERKVLAVQVAQAIDP